MSFFSNSDTPLITFFTKRRFSDHVTFYVSDEVISGSVVHMAAERVV